MSQSTDYLRRLVDNPQESLAVELKRWIDPSTDDGREKIAKACLALYNNNGGHLLVGMKDDGAPDTDNVPSDVRATFSADSIQAIVSKFSYTPFEVTVDYVERDGQEYPAVSVPCGVATPAVAKSELGSIHPDEVYVRSLTSNNTVSSTTPKRRDWDRLIKTCLDNREADIGAFFRRHLGISADIDTLRAAFSLPATLEERVTRFLDEGRERYEVLNKESNHPDVGHVEIGIIIDGPRDQAFRADQSFLNRLQNHRPSHTGWPPFVYIHNSREPDLNPYVSDGAWEANMHSPPFGMGPSTLDFWRMYPDGRFYTLRALEDDMISDRVERFSRLDPILHLRRIAEAISVGLSFADAMGYELAETQVAFAFRWTRLSGRQLLPWANPDRLLRLAPTCVDDRAIETVFVPADTPRSALSQYVEKVGAGLMLRFGGYDEISSDGIERIVNETFSR